MQPDGLKAFSELHSRPASFRMDVKATITTGSTSGGPLGGQAYRDDVNALPQRRMRIRDLLPVIGISTGGVEYPNMRTSSLATFVAILAEERIALAPKNAAALTYGDFRNVA